MASRRERVLSHVSRRPHRPHASLTTGGTARRAKARAIAETAAQDSVDLGLAGGDLPLWRAREALRNAESRLAAQVQAIQTLEGRATSMLGWSVTGLLALAAGLIGGTHVLAASAAAACLGVSAPLCVHCIMRRDFRMAGYDPHTLLKDESRSEYEALVSMAKGYQELITENSAAIKTQKKRLAIALVVMTAAPFLGLAALLLFPQWPVDTPPLLIPIRVELAWPVCRSAPHFAAHAGC